MRSKLCTRPGTEAPGFAFTRCRDVVVAVSVAGRLRLLGAVGLGAERLKPGVAEDGVDAGG
jgi:hypothetical protein